MTTIFHLSDVHFGPFHRPEVSAGVLAFLVERRPDLVILSGDLTQRAKPRQFQEARAFVDRLPVPSLVVPGNHDVPLYRVWERAVAPFGAYRKFFGAELEPSVELPGCLAVGLNTAFNWTWKEGRIHLRSLREAGRRFAAAAPGTLKVAVAHHPLVPTPRFGGQRVVRNAWEAVEAFDALGVDLVLSGHVHQGFIATSEEFYPRRRPPILFVNAGTTTSSRGRGGERGSNSANWISADGDQIEIQHLLWDPDRATFLERSRHFYPRQARRE